MEFADLEINLRNGQSDEYLVNLSFTRPGDDAVTGLGQLQPVARFDFEKFKELEQDEPLAYGQALTASLFADAELRAIFGKFRGAAEEGQYSLRVRLSIAPGETRLHALRWETLTDPERPAQFLATNQNILFSRFLSSQDLRPPRLQRPWETNGYVFIANPDDLAGFRPDNRRLAPIDVAGELQRAKDALQPLPLDYLNRGKQTGQRATLNQLMTALRVDTDKLTGGVSVLYLVCHGVLIDQEPYLVFEKEDGTTEMLPGSALIARLQELQRRPRLIVLASCQSAGEGTQLHSDDGGVLAALGPRLADVGIPAVVAMQGNITMETVKRLMPVFFTGLQRHGIIDLALATARSQIAQATQTDGRADWWAPALFMRLKSGRLWAGNETGSTANKFEAWPELLDDILAGKCTPILGPRLTESLIGSRQAIAQKLAEKFNLPISVHDRTDLPQVLQFLRIREKEDRATRYALRNMCSQMIALCGDALPDELLDQRPDQIADDEALIKLFGQLEEAAWEKLLQQNPREPHQVLAQLPFSIYLTTNPDGVLAKALTHAGKRPVIDLCRWNDELAVLPSYTADADVGGKYYPNRDQPFICHFFGRIEKPAFLSHGAPHQSKIKSTVLTEDDYFDFLLGFGRRNSSDNNTTNNLKLSNYVPTFVRSAMTNHKLLFLGFRMNDWSFRVLFRCIKIMEGHAGVSGQTHIAVQVDPEEDLEEARRYIQLYFSTNEVDIRFYPLSVESFVKELYAQWFSE